MNLYQFVIICSLAYMDVIFYVCIITRNFSLFVHYYDDTFSAEFMSNTLYSRCRFTDNGPLRAETCQNYNVGYSGIF
jgi:hypothetical protein